MINIQITNTNGQKYLMTGEEFVEGLEKYLRRNQSEEISTVGIEPLLYTLSCHFRDFLSTYEEKPTV